MQHNFGQLFKGGVFVFLQVLVSQIEVNELSLLLGRGRVIQTEGLLEVAQLKQRRVDVQ